jgi:hypothetical protein
MKQRVPFLSWLVAVALFVGTTVWNYTSFDPVVERVKRQSPELNPVPRVEVVRVFTMGMDALVADLYWISAVNYFGNNFNQRVCYAQLPSYMRLVTSLAPNFESAYRFAGLSIPCNDGKAWLYVDEADQFLREGIKRFPSNILMRLVLSYYLSSLKGDLVAAESELVEASKVKGCPEYVLGLATRMRTARGDLDGARQLAEELLANAPNDAAKDALRRRQREIESLKNINILNQARVVYEDRTKGQLKTIQDLVTSGLVNRIPSDPMEGEYVFDANSNEIVSTVFHDRLILFKKN